MPILYESLCSIPLLNEAFIAVKRNKGASGTDGVTIEEFESHLEKELVQIKEELEAWTYNPKPARRVEIPKPTGGVRLLGIPCVRDRVLQAAIKMLIEPALDSSFSDHSYGFRPNIGQKNAILAAREIVRSGKEYVVDIDLSKFFDRIHHDKLIGRLGNKITDKRILRLIGKMLRSGIMDKGLVKVPSKGSVQGSPLSPLLSNVVLDELDKELERRGLEFCRYADDCNIFVNSSKAGQRVMQNVTKFIEKRLKLKVNKDKSRVALSKFIKFLGVTIIAATIAISVSSMARAMAKVKELTPRGTWRTIEQDIKIISSWYMGWSAYYAITEYPAQLAKIEAHIRRRLRSRIVRQQKTPRNLFNKLVKRGCSKRLAGTAFSNRKSWALSHTRAVEKAFPNKWFIEELGLKIRSDEERDHWFDRKRWIKLM